jgi:cytidylate kinase
MSSEPLVVALDGPSGSGKSTLARALGGRLGLPVLDTGSMYRAVAAAALAAGVGDSSPAALAELALKVEVGQVTGQVFLAGQDLTGVIRTPAVEEIVSRVASCPEVRAALIATQRRFIQRFGGAVVEGRDAATAIWPDAQVKVFLTARPEIRAARRGRDQSMDTGEVIGRISRRDELDDQVNPLRPVAGALELDSSEMSVPELVERVVARLAPAANQVPAP